MAIFESFIQTLRGGESNFAVAFFGERNGGSYDQARQTDGKQSCERFSLHLRHGRAFSWGLSASCSKQQLA
jgi:hypothetical protein